MVIKSIYYDQNEILESIIQLYCNDGFHCDVTYGNGMFYRKINEPEYKFDIDPSMGVAVASSTSLPIADNFFKNVVFDPPFLTYIKKNRTGNGNMIMAKRFSGYWKYQELESHYTKTLKECSRVLKNKGLLIFKCQDIIHNHKMHATHINIVNWANDYGFSLKDMFILAAKNRLPAPNTKGVQRHARIYHCYFLVLQIKK